MTATPAVPVRVFVGAGSNIEPEKNLAMACGELHRRFGSLLLSSVYRSAPLGFQGEDFLNMVIAFDTREPPRLVLAELEALHRRAGRVRGQSSYVPRTLDLDLLLYGEEVIDEPGLHVPRDDITRFSFVLGPLAELAPSLRHPLSGESMEALWRRFDQRSHPIEKVSVAIGGQSLNCLWSGVSPTFADK